MLVDVSLLERRYYEVRPDMGDRGQWVAFGTSGHRGSSLRGTFTEAHVLAITQAICDFRQRRSSRGPLFMGMDTHALSALAQRTALEVLAGNGVEVFIQEHDGFTPTPVISRAILVHNREARGTTAGLADGIVITPSHNPPEDGGLKYNGTNGGPAAAETTTWVESRANELLLAENIGVKRLAPDAAKKAATTHSIDFVRAYVDDLPSVIDMAAIRAAGATLTLGVDPLGGASLSYWERIAEHYKLGLTVVNKTVDPTFGFMPMDHDGKIRMDCSSPYAMSGLVALKDEYRLAFANDPDADRHGIVTPGAGLMNPNHYLAVAIDYLLVNRPGWQSTSAVGKTVVSSSIIDRVVSRRGRKLFEVPVGFKWFAPGLFDGSICFGGEESAGASFLRYDGTAWTTDKDGIILDLLSAEITARTGKDPGEHYDLLAAELGTPFYTRVDSAASDDDRAKLVKLAPEAVGATSLAGDTITAKLTRAPGNDAPISGLKVVTTHGWFAARPSGTEPIYKIYAESFRSDENLGRIVTEAQSIVAQALRAGA